MKGVIFTEFLELVENAFGMQVADKILVNSRSSYSGFTSVGNYDYRDLIAMVRQLSIETKSPPADLVRAFGKHLFQRFVETHPHDFVGVTSTFDMLRKVETVIHVEVLKLHPDAELPRLTFPPAETGCFKLEYQSTRPFADLAGGLIQACADYFGESFTINRTDLAGPPGTHALFHLIPRK
jgi:hypothetical protein